MAIDHGLELVHAEVAGPENKPIVRIFIDKPQGVTHEDCSEVSLHLGTILDVEDFIHASYTLEVSSPGLERGLYKRADYERFAGSQAKMKTRQPIDGQRNFRGRLLGVDGDDVLFEDRTSGQVTSSARLDCQGEPGSGRQRGTSPRQAKLTFQRRAIQLITTE